MVECGRSMMVWVGFMCVIFTALICSSEARPPRTFHAGGRDGWRLLPDDGLNRWADKRRFRVNDTIGLSSHLLSFTLYCHHCNKTSPIHNMTDGFSRLKFTRNGPFYFISGYAQNCLNGQKLRAVVMSPNHRPSPLPAPQTPPPASTPPAASPWTSPSPSPSAETPPPPVNTPPAASPWTSPSPSPSAKTPPPLASTPPAASPWTSPSPSPSAKTPPPLASTPPASSPWTSPSPSPSAETPPPLTSPPPAASPWSPSPSPSTETPPPSPSPNVPAQPPPPPSSAGDGWITAPAPQKGSSPSSALISWGLTMAAGILISLV